MGFGPSDSETDRLHRARGILRAFLAAALLAAAAASAARMASQGGAPAALEVTLQRPQGPTRHSGETSQIVVSFSAPMVALGAIPERPFEAPLKLDPPAAGRFRWMGSSTLVFVPEPPLPPASRYQATVPAGTRALDGRALEQAVRWSFETPRPRLERTLPAAGERWAAPDTAPLLVFNQAVDPQRAQAGLSLARQSTAGAWQELKVQVRHASVEELGAGGAAPQPAAGADPLRSLAQRSLVLAPREPLALATRYRIRAAAGLRGAAGSLGLAQVFEAEFSTYGPLRFERLGSRWIAPDAGVTLHFSNPVRRSDLLRALRFAPEVELESEGWDDQQAEHTFYLPLEPGTSYRLELAPELEDAFGQTLGRKVLARFQTTDAPPQLSFVAGPGILEARGERRYPLRVLNLDAVQLRLARLDIEESIRLLSDEQAFYGPLRAPLAFDFETELDTSGPRNQARLLPIELDPVVAPGAHGWCVIEVESGHRDQPALDPSAERAFVQITDLGITSKFAPSSSLVLVTRLSDAAPVAAAEVELRDDQGKRLWSGRTDSQGLVEGPGWGPLGLRRANEWEPPRLWVVARAESDQALASSHGPSGIYPWAFGVEFDWNPRVEAYLGQVFSDRGLYRPGDTVHLKGLIRRNRGGDLELPGAAAFDLRISDPRGEELEVRRLRAGAFGGFSTDFALKSQAALGSYSFALSPAASGAGAPAPEAFAYGSFQVEAFRPATFSVAVRTADAEYQVGGRLKAAVVASYLSGGALQGERIEWKLRRLSAAFTPPGYDAYRFGPLAWLREEAEPEPLLASAEARLDASGSLELEVPLAGEGMLGSARLLFEATVTAPDRRQITGRAGAILHRGAAYLGLRAATAVARSGEAVEIESIAVSPQGDPAAGLELKLAIVRRQWLSVRKAGLGGRLEWISQTEDTEVASFEIASGAAPMTQRWTAEQGGFHILRLTGRDGAGNPLLTEDVIYVAGPGYVAWPREDSDRIELKSDRPSYRPGDTARILIPSPFERAPALVTVERERVIERRLIEVVGSSVAIELPLGAEHLPNVFVSVILLQGRSALGKFGARGQDLGKPTFRIGYIELPVDPGAKHLEVAVAVDREQYRPRDPVEVRLEVRGSDGRPAPAEVTLAVVDRGVLDLIAYSLPDPFELFYGPRPLAVTTIESREHVIGERDYGAKGDGAGGGGGLAALRGEFVATAYWNGEVQTGADGRAAVRFELPDNLSRFKVMAVAQTADARFGRGQHEFRVDQPLVLRPALPRLVRVGDRVEAGVLVQNNLDTPARAEIEASADGIELDGAAARAVELAAGASREVRFGWKAERPGVARIQFRARMAGERDGLDLRLPIELPRPSETVALSSSTTESARELLYLPRERFESGELEVSAAVTGLIGLEPALHYLVTYPYGCLEQVSSALRGLLWAHQLAKAFGVGLLDGRDIPALIQSKLDSLAAYRTWTGGLSYWPGGERVDPFTSAYAAELVAQAEAAGFAIAPPARVALLSYLQALLRGERDGDFEYYTSAAKQSTLALAAYAAARLGQSETAALEALLAQADALPSFAHAYLARALKLGGDRAGAAKLLQQLRNRLQLAPRTAYLEQDDPEGGAAIFDSSERTTAVGLLALLDQERPEPLAERMVAWLLEAKRKGRWSSTQDNAYVLEALAVYLTRFESGQPDLRARIELGGELLLEEAFRGRSAKVARAERDLSALPAGPEIPVAIDKQGAGRLYYALRWSYTPKGAAPPRDEGIALLKTLRRSGESAPRTEFQAGDLVEVELTFASARERLYVAVNDPIPAGFEIVNTRFATEASRADEPQADSPFVHIERRDAEVRLFADRLPAGVHVYRYLCRALAPGDFELPPTHAEEMYHPEVFGRTGSARVRIHAP
ncbi:MAG TPA: MG2 domain-containing protein [Acidobacteriota bacterium]